MKFMKMIINWEMKIFLLKCLDRWRPQRLAIALKIATNCLTHLSKTVLKVFLMKIPISNQVEL